MLRWDKRQGKDELHQVVKQRRGRVETEEVLSAEMLPQCVSPVPVTAFDLHKKFFSVQGTYLLPLLFGSKQSSSLAQD
jgi:hypothetical protein